MPSGFDVTFVCNYADEDKSDKGSNDEDLSMQEQGKEICEIINNFIDINKQCKSVLDMKTLVRIFNFISNRESLNMSGL